jgi:hypothetical protein
MVTGPFQAVLTWGDVLGCEFVGDSVGLVDWKFKVVHRHPGDVSKRLILGQNAALPHIPLTIESPIRISTEKRSGMIITLKAKRYVFLFQ